MRESHRGRSNELRILCSVRGPSLAAHSASHSTSSCPPLLQLLHGITESTPYIPSTQSSSFSGLISGCCSCFIRYWMNVCCKVWGSAHDLSCTQNRKTGAFRGTLTGETKTSLYHTRLDMSPSSPPCCYFTKNEYTCKKCDKVWASLGLFFFNKDCRQDTTAASVCEPSEAFCSGRVPVKAWCRSCWKTTYLSIQIKVKVNSFLYSTTLKSAVSNLDNILCYALWPQLLQKQQELQLFSVFGRNLERVFNFNLFTHCHTYWFW